MLVHVTADHIARGEKLMRGRCPIALALNEAYPKTVHHLDHEIIERSMEVAKLYGQPVRVTVPFWKPTRSIVRFIRRFDAGKPVRPFSFRIQP